MAEVDELRQAVEREYPRYDERAGDWDDVLRRAATAPPRRSRWIFRGGVVAGAAVAVVALLLVAPWRAETGILDRALAAVGDGPVLHVVLRDDLQAGSSLVDVRTGDRKRISGTKEFWYDARRGRVREISRFGGVIEDDRVYSLRALRPAAIIGPGVGSSLPEVGKFSRDYRNALKTGKARVTGRGVIHGIPVYWITLPPRVGMNVSGPNQRAPRPVERVAISRETFKPVAIREKQVGWPCKPSCLTTSLRVFRMESVAADAADLTPSPVASGDRLSSGNYAIRGPREIPLGQAAEILGRTPFWLGREHEGLRLAHASSVFFRVGAGPERPGLDFFYGESTEGKPYISITETTDRDFAARIRNYGSSLRPGSRMGYVPPEGSVLVTRKRFGVFGFLVRDGVYVRMEASGEKLLLDAARALRPLSAEGARATS